jgi:hypothetical protein
MSVRKFEAYASGEKQPVPAISYTNIGLRVIRQGNSTYFFHLKYPLNSVIFLKKIPPQSQIEPKVRSRK